MTSETRRGNTGKSCEEGGSIQSSLITEVTVCPSWYKTTAEGVPDMEIQAAFINSASVAGAPKVEYSAYRTVYCRRPAETHIEAVLSFGNLSSFSCLTPDRLKKLIGAEYYMATDGVSLLAYTPSGVDLHDTRLEFTFRMMAPCAVGATIRLMRTR